MAKYLLLIFGDEQIWDSMAEQEREDHQAAHAAFVAAAGDAVLGGHELMRPSTATTLRGGPTPTDGPFLETKEVLGGFYVIEAPDLDAAIAMTERLPEVSAGHSGVEIRPIREQGN
jgi:hypothetical protein